MANDATLIATGTQENMPWDADPVLTVEHLTMRFGGLVAISDLSFHVGRGDITALIGPNGAGKTTVFNCVTGFYKPTEGRIVMRHGPGQQTETVEALTLSGDQYRRDGSNAVFLLERMPDFTISHKAKVARTFQNIRLFGGMTALENLLVAQHNPLMVASNFTIGGILGLPSFKQARDKAIEKAVYWLEQVHLIDRADDPAADLPYGAQRRLEIARAMCTEPHLLCLDEPAAGLNPRESAELNALLKFIRKEHGTSVLLIEHDMGVVMEISDHIVVLDYGEKISDGSAEHVRNDPKVIAAYLGVDEEEAVEEAAAAKKPAKPAAARKPAARGAKPAAKKAAAKTAAAAPVAAMAAPAAKPSAKKAAKSATAAAKKPAATKKATGAAASSAAAAVMSAPVEKAAPAKAAKPRARTVAATASRETGGSKAKPAAKKAAAKSTSGAVAKSSAKPGAAAKSKAAPAKAAKAPASAKAAPAAKAPAKSASAKPAARKPAAKAVAAPSKPASKVTAKPTAKVPAKAAAKPAKATKPATAKAPSKPAAKTSKPTSAKSDKGGSSATKSGAGKTAAKAKPEAVRTLKAPRGGKADNLTLIKGIGKVNEGKLNAHGIYHFDQIAAWKAADVKSVETYLEFDGRIAREGWIRQAKVLAKGGETEFSKRVAKGEVPTSHATAPAGKRAKGGKK